MDYLLPIAGLVIALIALAQALSARKQAQEALTGIEEARADTRRQARNVAEALRRELFIVQQFMIRSVSSEELTPEMVREGLLWREVGDKEAQDLMAGNSNFFLLDVRSPDETAEGIIPGALCIPVDEIAERKEEIPKTGQPVLVYCAGGGRSLGVCEELSHAGFERLHNLQGGFMGWTGAVAKPS